MPVRIVIPLLYFEGQANPLRGQTISYNNLSWTVTLVTASAVHLQQLP